MSVFEAQQIEHLLLLCAAASVAGFIRGFAGFGGPATIILLLAHFFVPATLLPKVALLDFYAYPILIWNVRREAQWKISLPIAACVIAMLPLGLFAMQSLDPTLLKKLIGIVCLGAVLVSMSGYRFKRKPPLLMNLVVALVLGWLLGTTYVALPLASYFLLMPLPAAECRATVISFTVLVMPFIIATLFWQGVIVVADILPVGAAGIAYMLMAAAGSWFFSKVSGRDYRNAARWLLLVLSVTVLI